MSEGSASARRSPIRGSWVRTGSSPSRSRPRSATVTCTRSTTRTIFCGTWPPTEPTWGWGSPSEGGASRGQVRADLLREIFCLVGGHREIVDAAAPAQLGERQLAVQHFAVAQKLGHVSADEDPPGQGRAPGDDVRVQPDVGRAVRDQGVVELRAVLQAVDLAEVLEKQAPSVLLRAAQP